MALDAHNDETKLIRQVLKNLQVKASSVQVMRQLTTSGSSSNFVVEGMKATHQIPNITVEARVAIF
jgi:hypothetical protein